MTEVCKGVAVAQQLDDLVPRILDPRHGQPTRQPSHPSESSCGQNPRPIDRGHRRVTTFFAPSTQPLSDVRVVIVGQDPYPTPGHAVGLSFSVAPDVRPIPRSLTNIYTELAADLGVAAPSNGDLTPWTTQGVLLLNRVLTVQQGQPGSHRGHGWEEFTEAAITAIAARPDQPVVAILWGNDAQTTSGLFDDAPVIASPHPSPMSADRGFFGSRPFSRANELLEDLGAEPIDWSLP